jgi:hypothetical protein
MEDAKFASSYNTLRRAIVKGEKLCEHATITTSIKHTEKTMWGGRTAEYIVAGVSSLAPAALLTCTQRKRVEEVFPTCAPAAPPQRPTIMFLGINTSGEATLSVHKEYTCIRNELEERVEKAEQCCNDRFVLDLDCFNTSNNLLKRLGKLKPAVLHLACHGESDGLHFYGSFVKGQALFKCVQLLSRSKDGRAPRVVVVNACNSENVAQELAECVEFVIGHAGLLPDDEAIGFSEAFYGQLAEGSAVSDAFDAACTPASREGYQLFARKGKGAWRVLGGRSCGSDLAHPGCCCSAGEPRPAGRCRGGQDAGTPAPHAAAAAARHPGACAWHLLVASTYHTTPCHAMPRAARCSTQHLAPLWHEQWTLSRHA